MRQSSCKRVVCFDLDDTLYKERDFVFSAFHEIASLVARKEMGRAEDNFQILSSYYDLGLPPFQELDTKLTANIPLSWYLNVYRHHRPKICLEAGAIQLLTSLSEANCVLGLITDGRSVTQRNKIDVLGLNRFFRKDDIVISEEFGSMKPAERNYRYFSDRYPQAHCYYVADNTRKDFLAPNHLGWTSICLLDNGKNVHKQDFKLEDDYLPTFKVKALQEVEAIVLSVD